MKRFLARLLAVGRSDTPTGRVSRNTGWLLTSKALAGPLGFLQTAIAARLLGVSEFGALGLIVTLTTVAQLLVGFRMNEFVVRYLPPRLDEGRQREAAAFLKAGLLVESASSLIGFVALWCAAPWLSRWFLDGTAAVPLIRIFAFSVLGTAALQSSLGALQAFDRFRTQFVWATGLRCGLLLGVLAAWAAGAELRHFVVAYAAAHGLAGVWVTARAWREAGRRLGGDWFVRPIGDLEGKVGEASRFALSTNVSGTLSLVVKDADLLWIGYFLPNAQVGLYRVALSVVKLFFAPTGPMARAIYPELSRALGTDRPRVALSLIRRFTALSAAWVLPLGLLLFVFSRPLLVGVYGPEFADAAAALRFLVVGMGISQILLWKRPALLSLGMAGFALTVSAVNAALKVPLVFWALPGGSATTMAVLTGSLYFGSAMVLAGTAWSRIRGRTTRSDREGTAP